MVPPIIDLSQLLNEVNHQIEAIEKKMLRYQVLIEIFDERLREIIGLAKEVAECQLDVLREFKNQPPSLRQKAITNLDEKLAIIRQEYIESFHSLVHAREGVIEEGKLIRLDSQKREQLEEGFTQRLDEKLAKYRSEFHLDESTNLSLYEQQLEEKIRFRTQIYDQIFGDKEKLTLEQQDLEEMIKPQFKALILHRESLKKNLQVADLFSASQVGAVEFIQDQISKQFWKSRFVNQKHPKGFTALHTASYLNHTEVIGLLIEAGADPTAKDAYGYQPLHFAAQKGSYEATKLLLKKKAPINGRGEYERTPLHMAVFNSKMDTTLLLMRKGAEVNAQTSAENHLKTPLHDAVLHGDVNMVTYLTKSPNLNVNIRDSIGLTPLRHAVENELLEISFLILKHPSWQDSPDPQDPNSIENMLRIHFKREKEVFVKNLRAYRLSAKVKAYKDSLWKQEEPKLRKQVEEFTQHRKRELQTQGYSGEALAESLKEATQNYQQNVRQQAQNAISLLTAEYESTLVNEMYEG